MRFAENGNTDWGKRSEPPSGMWQVNLNEGDDYGNIREVWEYPGYSQAFLEARATYGPPLQAFVDDSGLSRYEYVQREAAAAALQAPPLPEAVPNPSMGDPISHPPT